EKTPIFYDGSAKGEARLIAFEGRIFGQRGGKRIACIHSLVPKVLKQTSAKLICTGLRNNVDRSSADTPKLSLVAAAIDLEFLHGLLADRWPHSIVRDVVVVHAVYRDVVGSPVLTSEGEPRGRKLSKH